MGTGMKRIGVVVCGMALVCALACGSDKTDDANSADPGKTEKNEKAKPKASDLAVKAQAEVDAFAAEIPQEQRDAFTNAIAAGKDAG